MNEIDMSRPGNELFQEAPQDNHNSYGVTQDQFAGDPLNMGVKQPTDGAGQEKMSDKEMNFSALRGEVSKAIQEREYWKGKAEAALETAKPVQPKAEDPFKGWDMDYSPTGKDVKTAFESMQQQNNDLRNEMRDQLAAIATKSRLSDWDEKVTAHVPKLTSTNPIFAEMINNVSNPYEAAYLLADLNSRATSVPQQAPAPVETGSNAHRALANAQKPLSASSIGGHGQLSSADYYAQMSDKDFADMAMKNLANI